MFRIPFLTPLIETVKGYISRLEEKNLTELPSALQIGLERNLTPGEEVIVTLRNFRAIYKAPTWLDSNTYFNSWFILTNQRVLILRNSSSIKMFRDISLDDIKRTHYEIERLKPRITIISQEREDNIDFAKEALSHCEDIHDKINDAVEKAKKRGTTTLDVETIYCHNCGIKIPRHSNYCSECGHAIYK